jgi:hypothetical protein
MPRTGRPPTPTEIKRKRGTLRPDRQPGGSPLTVLPSVAKAPLLEDVGLDGQGVIQALLDAGISAWVGTTDKPLLGLLADALDERRTIRTALYRTPPSDLDPKALMGWFATTRKDLRDLEKQITQWLSLLGLTPTDRTRLGVAEVKARSTLEELADRREARLAGRQGS